MRTPAVLLTAFFAAAPAAAQATDSARIYQPAEVEVLPRAQNAAEFAAALRQARSAGGETGGGTVLLSLVVGGDGVPRNIRVASSTNPALDSATAATAAALRFTPAMVGGRPVAVLVQLPVAWEPPAATPDSAARAAGGACDADFCGTGAGDAGRAYELADVEALPEIRNRAAFVQALRREYPPALRSQGIEGIVHVRFRVEVDGSTTQRVVMQASDPGFVEATLRAVAVLRFAPARIDGRPVPVWVLLPVAWAL